MANVAVSSPEVAQHVQAAKCDWDWHKFRLSAVRSIFCYRRRSAVQ